MDRSGGRRDYLLRSLAAAIGYPCSNLRGHYFAIASIAFAEIVRIVFNNWKMVGAAEGLTIPMLKESLANFMFHSSKLPYYYIMLAFLLLAVAVCYWVSTSKMGYYFRAIKESHEIAQVLGVNVVRYRLYAIMISAFLTSMAGTFYAQYILYIDPESVMILAISVQIVLVAMLGGASTVLGPVVGAAILIPLSEYSRAWLGYKGTGVDMIIYGALITVISMYQPNGVWGAITNLVRREQMSASLLLDVQGVSKYFGGLQANEDVSFQVNQGEIVSIIGPNGAGKSTLFSCITGFHRLDKGRVLFKGQDITNRKPHMIGKLGIVRTFQIVQVISDMTVLENVMTGGFLRHTRVNDVRRKAEEVLAFTGLMEKRNYNALALSVSDKKRLEVSMALAMEPELLMLDESMAGLTPVELREMIELIRKVRERGITVVVVEHVMEAVMELSDRVIVLNSGRKIVEGSPKEVVANPEVIRAYLGEGYNAVRQ